VSLFFGLVLRVYWPVLAVALDPLLLNDCSFTQSNAGARMQIIRAERESVAGTLARNEQGAENDRYWRCLYYPNGWSSGLYYFEDLPI